MAAIDLDAITKRNADAVVDFITLTFRAPGETPDEALAQTFMKKVVEGLGDNSTLVGEVKRLREQRQKIRDLHAPANSHDPAAPGAICTGCSLHGARIDWPCATWKATEDGDRP